MCRGKVIGRVVIVVILDTKIIKSGDLGTQASYKHNEYGEKLGSVCLESSDMAYSCYK